MKWGQNSFKNFRIVPPGFGIVHQVNLEYIARVVFDNQGVLYPDSVVGTDSHTTMINGLGVVGWGVGGIEAEAVMLGESTVMVLPQVIGFKLTGKLNPQATATDLVLLCTKMLRAKGVVDKFVEFFGPGAKTLSLADRATISNMAPEYGATIGFFPVDERTLSYLETTGRSAEDIERVKQYLTLQGMFKNYDVVDDLVFTDVIELDLSTVEPSVAGPKRPHDFVKISGLKADWNASLTNEVGFKGFGLKQEQLQSSSKLEYQGQTFNLNHGSVVIAAITSCTNTSNPGVMLSAALLCKKAYERGIKILPYIKTSLSPGSQAVSKYFERSGLTQYLNAMGFFHAGYGCMTCIGNSGEIAKEVEDAIRDSDLCVASVLSGNRNFEGRVHPMTKANFLASPPLVVAFAIAGTVNIDFETEPIAKDKDGNDVFLREIWPSREEVEEIEKQTIKPDIFIETYKKVSTGTERWNKLQVTNSTLFNWSDESTYIHRPPFFDGADKQPAPLTPIQNANILAVFGDSITTDHISPAGNISVNSPAGRFLKARGIEKKDFNTYGARRGNDLIMARGTFANIRIINKMNKGKVGPQTVYVPTGETMDIFDAAEKYQQNGKQLVIFGGKEYGSGSSRDWAAKGPYLQGVKAVIAQSFERIHRSNLIGMGILPLTFKEGENAETYGITGEETVTIEMDLENIKPNQFVKVNLSSGKTIEVLSNLRTEVEITYYKNKGVLPFVLRKQL